MIWRHISMVSYIQHTRFRKMDLLNMIVCQRKMLQGNGKIIFHHSNRHIAVLFRLTLNMIDMAPNPYNRIGNHFTEFLVMLIPQLLKLLLVRVYRSENFVNQRNQKVRYLLCDCTKYIIKNCTAAGFAPLL